MKRFVRLAGAALVLGVLASPAFAHAMLQKAVPAVGSTVAVPPSRVVLHFSEGVEPAFSSIEVHDAAGARVDAGDVHTAPGDDRTLVVTVTLRGPGSYTVAWHATSVDTHKTEGRFVFRVTP